MDELPYEDDPATFDSLLEGLNVFNMCRNPVVRVAPGNTSAVLVSSGTLLPYMERKLRRLGWTQPTEYEGWWCLYV